MNEGRAMEQADYGPPADSPASVSAGKRLKTPAVKVRENAEGSSATKAMRTKLLRVLIIEVQVVKGLIIATTTTCTKKHD